jgi:hypothetical protein
MSEVSINLVPEFLERIRKTKKIGERIIAHISIKMGVATITLYYVAKSILNHQTIYQRRMLENNTELISWDQLSEPNVLENNTELITCDDWVNIQQMVGDVFN